MAFSPKGSIVSKLLVYLLLFCWIACIRALCPTHECYCLWGGELDCSDIDMRRIPYFRPGNDTYIVLGLGQNRIRRIRARAFENLLVDNIELVHNKRPFEVHPRAFSGLEQVLKGLTMRSNHFINGLPRGIFRKMEKLRNVDLGYNNIANISRGVFLGAYGLRSLSLVRNQLVTLEANAFVGLINLKRLRLTENKINFVDSKAFNGLKNLEELGLQDNLIRDLQPRTFKRLRSLTRLDLSDNRLAAIFPLMFKGLQRLESLKMTDNDIIIVADDVFVDMGHLKDLYLDHAKLAMVKPGMFRGLTNLTQLDLSGNMLTSLPDDVFELLPALRKILLRKNQLSTINACAFTDINKLSEIWVDDNKILCECSLKWTSLAHTPNIYGKCAAPALVSGKEIAEQEKYIVCQGNDLGCKRNNGMSQLNSNDVMDSWRHYWKRFF